VHGVCMVCAHVQGMAEGRGGMVLGVGACTGHGWERVLVRRLLGQWVCRAVRVSGGSGLAPVNMHLTTRACSVPLFLPCARCCLQVTPSTN